MNCNDLFLEELNFLLFPEPFPIDPPNFLTPFNEIISLIKQVESLSIDIHTQSLPIEVEWVKRQKLSSTLKRVKREIILSHHLLTQAQYDITMHCKELQDLKIKHEDEVARLRSLTYRGFFRLDKILIAVTPMWPRM